MQSEEFDDLIDGGVAEAIDRTNIIKRLSAGNKLRVKLGIDPSKPDLHIGHSVALRKLRQFQAAGHTAVIIIGDYTAQLGDPSDRSESRILISAAETKRNAKSVLSQILRLLDKDKTEVHYNSAWFDKFSLRDVLELMARSTLNQLLSHETFQKRLDDQQPLYSQEIIYPLMQGYDSVMVKADLELGGIDQKFNILQGRVMQRAYEQPEQDILLMPYLPGTDGQPKMSKSSGNTINLNDLPADMYGKTMSIPDELIMDYFRLATLVPARAIDLIERELADAKTNPRDIKMQLAREIVTLYHGLAAATEAEQAFIAQFQRGQLPENIKSKTMAGSYKTAVAMLIDSGLVASGSEGRRLIEQGGVRLNGQLIDNPLSPIKLKKGTIIQVGKQRYLKVK